MSRPGSDMGEGPAPRPPPAPASAGRGRVYVRHRADLLLLLAVLGFLTFGQLGLLAFVLAQRDLEDMDVGRMDPSGRQRTEIAAAVGRVSAYMLLLLPLAIIHVCTQGSW